jgi:hypothetical protein
MPAATGSFSASNQEIKHNYQSAVGQSGIAAGDGGFDISVGGNTELVGAAITSTQQSIDENRNSLTTASLVSRDLENVQTTESSGSSLSVSYGGGSALATLGQNAVGNLLGNLNGEVGLPEDREEHGVTQSVISPAKVTLTGTGDEAIDRQSEETVALLTSRDPETANQGLENTLTLQQAQVLEEKLQQQRENQEAARLVGGVLAGIVGDMTQGVRKNIDDANERQRIDKQLADGQILSDQDKQLLARFNQEGMTSEKATQTLDDLKAHLGQVIGSGVNGFLQTGTSEGFAKGILSGLIPQDLGLSDAYNNDPVMNIMIGIVRDGLRGSMVSGDMQGFQSGVLIGQTGNILGHAAGLLIADSGPKFVNGVFFYEGKFHGSDAKRGSGLTLGNVISGPPGLSKSTESWLYRHEMNHIDNPVEKSFGALYAPLHALDLLTGYTVKSFGGGNSGFIIEEHIQKFPYSSRPVERTK